LLVGPGEREFWFEQTAAVGGDIVFPYALDANGEPLSAASRTTARISLLFFFFLAIFGSNVCLNRMVRIDSEWSRTVFQRLSSALFRVRCCACCLRFIHVVLFGRGEKSEGGGGLRVKLQPGILTFVFLHVFRFIYYLFVCFLPITLQAMR
jgi:hypothetical protein